MILVEDGKFMGWSLSGALIMKFLRGWNRGVGHT